MTVSRRTSLKTTVGGAAPAGYFASENRWAMPARIWARADQLLVISGNQVSRYNEQTATGSRAILKKQPAGCVSATLSMGARTRCQEAE
jgi:hypothetical protein